MELKLGDGTRLRPPSEFIGYLSHLLPSLQPTLHYQLQNNKWCSFLGSVHSMLWTMVITYVCMCMCACGHMRAHKHTIAQQLLSSSVWIEEPAQNVLYAQCMDNKFTVQLGSNAGRTSVPSVLTALQQSWKALWSAWSRMLPSIASKARAFAHVPKDPPGSKESGRGSGMEWGEGRTGQWWGRGWIRSWKGVGLEALVAAKS